MIYTYKDQGWMYEGGVGKEEGGGGFKNGLFT